MHYLPQLQKFLTILANQPGLHSEQLYDLAVLERLSRGMAPPKQKPVLLVQGWNRQIGPGSKRLDVNDDTGGLNTSLSKIDIGVQFQLYAV